MDKLDQQLQHSIHGEFDQGWKLVQELEKERPTCNRYAFNRGWYILAQGKLKQGMDLISRGRFEHVFGSPHIGTPKPIYDGRLLLKNEFVLLHLEGGFGDEMIGVRFANEIKKQGGRCVISCHPKLMSLFSRIDGVEALVDSSAAKMTYFDFWLPAMSAEYAMGYEYDTLPNKKYISAEPDHINKFKHIINNNSNKLKIGIRYNGNPEFEHVQHRLFPEELMFNLFEDLYDQVEVYSLQKDINPKIKYLPNKIIDLESKLETWEDTAGAISNLDLVISSCTSIAHLSAAMGKPTWVIVPILGYYVWAYKLNIDIVSQGEYTSYYDAARLFRQTKYGVWQEPFIKIKQGLKNLLEIKNGG
jgi:hypothetical protein